ncbi:MAG: SGNH/GDSL hydrolase family protein [Candidatus Lokiarchaeota archaeon]|nr:SGNH/GDSL hydrolase family protein [Candidatus Lokiarchaeota archaeon]
MNILKQLTRNWKKEPNKAIRIIAFGSSNTELHWHSLGHFNWFSWLTASFREWIGRHVTTLNQGINGETVEDLLKRIDRDVINYKPEVTFITIGGNDANAGMALGDYRASLEKIIDKLYKINCLPILQTYYCPIYELMPETFQKFPEYMEIKRVISSERQIPLIDQYKYFSALYQNEKNTYSELMLDGLHVNPIGNAIMGLIACRSCYLPDPVFLDIKFENKVQIYLDKMNQYLELPSSVKVSRHEIVKKSYRAFFLKN